MGYDDDRAAARARLRRTVEQGRVRVLPPRKSRWTARTGLAWWIGYALAEPREFTYVAPRRAACHLFSRHNPTCIGRGEPHPRRW